RSAETVAAWLQAHPGVTVVSRDRAGLYADGASRGAPQAVQVAARWHLVDNRVDALERFLLHQQLALKQTAAAVQPALPANAPADEMSPGRRKHPPPRAWLELAEVESQRRHAARVACYQRIQALAAAGADNAANAATADNADNADIARMAGVSRQTVHRSLALGAPPELRQPKRRGEVLEPWQPHLLRRWAEGCHKALRLWREIR